MTPVAVNVSMGAFRIREKISGVVIEIGFPLVAPDGSSGMQYLYEAVEG